MDNAISILITCAGSEGSGQSAHLHNNGITYAGSNVDLITAHANSECCGESVPATMTHLINHQCVVSMLQKCSQCVIITIPKKTFASLPRKNRV